MHDPPTRASIPQKEKNMHPRSITAAVFLAVHTPNRGSAIQRCSKRQLKTGSAINTERPFQTPLVQKLAVQGRYNQSLCLRVSSCSLQGLCIKSHACT